MPTTWLRSVVGVMHGLPGWWAAPPDSHLQGVDDELGADVISDRPADHPPRPGVNDDREIHLALDGGMLGDIGNPQPVRAVRGELARDQIVAGNRVRVAAGATTAAFVDPDDPIDPHQSLDAFAAAANAIAEHQFGVYPRAAIAAAGDAVDLADPFHQFGVGDTSPARIRLRVRHS